MEMNDLLHERLLIEPEHFQLDNKMRQIIKRRLNTIILIVLIIAMAKQRFQKHKFLTFAKILLDDCLINNQIAFTNLKHDPNNLLLLPLVCLSEIVFEL